MSKFKVGDMALVEVKIVGEDTRINEYQLKPIKNAWTFWSDKDMVHPIVSKDTNIQNKTYEDGLNEAWELAKKICDYCNSATCMEFMRLFGTSDVKRVLFLNNPQQASGKIKELEDKRKFYSGDFVRKCNKDKYGIVIKVDSDNDKCDVLWDSLKCETEYCATLEKTGKNIDLVSFVKNLAEDS